MGNDTTIVSVTVARIAGRKTLSGEIRAAIYMSGANSQNTLDSDVPIKRSPWQFNEMLAAWYNFLSCRRADSRSRLSVQEGASSGAINPRLFIRMAPFTPANLQYSGFECIRL